MTISTALQYNVLLLDELETELLSLVNFFHEKKKDKICMPSDEVDLLNSNDFIVLINEFSEKCTNEFDMEELQEIRLNTNYEKINFLIYSITYTNIIKFKNIDYYLKLKKLYIFSFLLEYNSNISVKDRKKHIFDNSKYTYYCDEMSLKFKDGIQVSEEVRNGVKTFSAMDIQEELRTFCWLFWKFCSIKASYGNIENKDQFELIRILSNDLKLLQEFKKKIYFKIDKNQNAIKKLASSGGKAKAENYKIKMKPIFENFYKLYKDGNPEKSGEKWRSKNKCAHYFIKKYYANNSKTELDLDPKKLVIELTKQINEASTSKRVNILVS